MSKLTQEEMGAMKRFPLCLTLGKVMMVEGGKQMGLE
jgi:hypothetical protein